MGTEREGRIVGACPYCEEQAPSQVEWPRPLDRGARRGRNATVPGIEHFAQ